MVDTVKANDEKLATLQKRLKEAKDPIEVDGLLAQIDNLLDIRLSNMEAKSGN